MSLEVFRPVFALSVKSSQKPGGYQIRSSQKPKDYQVDVIKTWDRKER